MYHDGMTCVRLRIAGFAGVAVIACHSSTQLTSSKDGGPPKDATATGGTASGGTGGQGGAATSGSDGQGGVAIGGAVGTGGGAAGGTHGTGGTAGSTSLDPTEVCRAVLRAQAERIALCLGTSTVDWIMRAAIACPDYAFNPDSNRTVEEMAACLPALAARTCTDLALSIMPPCFATGKRAPNTGCAFNSQCTSGVCMGGSSRCGSCYDGVKPAGGSCAVDYQCATGSYCSRSQGSGTCVDNNTVVYAAQGEACDLDTIPAVGCVGDLYCKTSGLGSAGTCLPAPGVGQPCASNGINSSTICAAGTTCTSHGTCDVPGACSSAGACDSASACVSTGSGLACVPLASVGQACSTSSGDTLPPCLAPAVCDGRGTCVGRRTAGETCDTANPCADFLMCVSGTCQPIVAASCPA